MPYNLEEDPGQQTNAAGAYLEITRERSGHKAYGAAPRPGPTRTTGPRAVPGVHLVEGMRIANRNIRAVA